MNSTRDTSRPSCGCLYFYNLSDGALTGVSHVLALGTLLFQIHRSERKAALTKGGRL